MSTEACDVLVVGGGFAGRAAACALAAGGLDVLVLDAAGDDPAAGPNEERPLALSRGSSQVLEGLVGTAWARLRLEVAAPILGVHVSEAGGFGYTRIRADALGVPALGYVVGAGSLANALAHSVNGAPGVRTVAGVLTDLALGAERAVAAARGSAGSLRIEARLVVAADGAASRVRALCGVRVRRRDYRQHALVAEVDTELDPRGWAYERFTSHGPLALLPMRSVARAGTTGRCAVVWTMRAADARELAAAPESRFRRGLEETFGTRLGRVERASARASFPLALVASRSAVHARVAFVGNAANQLHPVAGQGLNLGLRDVAVLADAVLGARDPGAPKLLARYAAVRRADWQRTVGATDALAFLFRGGGAAGRLGRGLGLLLTDLLPGVKSSLAMHAMGTRPLGGLRARSAAAGR